MHFDDYYFKLSILKNINLSLFITKFSFKFQSEGQVKCEDCLGPLPLGVQGCLLQRVRRSLHGLQCELYHISEKNTKHTENIACLPEDLVILLIYLFSP